jgi:hypothetical protein
MARGFVMLERNIHYMLITQAGFQEYKDMDSALISQFQEHEQEARARKFLEEGVSHHLSSHECQIYILTH